MKAGYLVAPGRIEVRDVDVPPAEAGGIVVRVRVALTDGTDLKAFRRGHPQMPMPTRFGHEFSGDVAAVGAGVDSFAPGDPVMSVHSAPDNTCYWCLRGQEELCESVMQTKILGAYAEYVAIPPHIVRLNCFPKPAGVSYEAAAFLEPLSCVAHSLRALASAPGDVVVVIGDGGFGLLHALLARARGARPVLVGRRPERLALARTLGITDTLEARGATPDAVRALTGGRGADAVVESTGALDVWEATPSYVRRGGTVLLFGGLPGGTRVSFDAARLHYDEIRVVSPFHFTPRAVREARDALASHSIDVVPLISGRFGLDGLSEAFRALDEGGGLNLKYAIVP